MNLRGAAAIRAKLEQSREMAFLSKQLATIACEAPVQAKLQTLKYHGADRSKIAALFDRLGFGKIRQRIVKWKK
jgi:DNA polymerase-1